MNAIEILESELSASALSLNYDYLCKLFKHLGVAECMNLSEAHDGLQYVADWKFKIKLNTSFNDDLEKLGDVERVLYHIRPFIKSLKLQWFEGRLCTEDDLVKIQENCERLKRLSLFGFERSVVKNNPFRGASYNLESLTLTHCFLANDGDFLSIFTNLKSLNFVECTGISNISMQKCFEKNQGIKSFVSDTKCLRSPQLLQLLPNLERLGLLYGRIINLEFLSKLNSLRCLTLHTYGGVNEVLEELAEKNQLEELELSVRSIDPQILMKFHKLHRLVIRMRNHKFSWSNNLPLRLKTLKLAGFHISQRRIISIIEEQKHLQNIHLDDCTLQYKKNSFSSMAKSIGRKCALDGNRKVNLFWTSPDAQSSKEFAPKSVVTSCLYIANYLRNNNEFKIVFPGMYDIGWRQ